MATKKVTEAKGKVNPFEKVVQNLPFHDFEENSKYTGIYVNTLTLGDTKEKEFTVNVFANAETGEEHFITNSYSIEKAIKQAKAKYENNLSDLVFQIEFLGKTEVHGKPFNQFNISVCPLEAYNEFIKE
jgi:hypothetical protein